MIDAELQGKLVTVIGGSGFLGRYIVGRLLKAGAMVRVAVRNRESANHLKPLARPGQLSILSVNILDEQALELVIADSTYVINLVGVIAERGAQKFQQIHVLGAGNVARIARMHQVKKLIHVSAIGASEQSAADYARTKALGEAAVSKNFPGVIIIRPSLVFGPHDHFFNMMASLIRLLPIVPLIGTGVTRFQPVYAGDIALAVHKILLEKKPHKIYELGGSDIITMQEMMAVLIEEIGYRRFLIPIPFWLSTFVGWILSCLPNPPLTAEQVSLLRYDNVVDSRLPGLADLGITPQTLTSILPSYMDAYSKGGRYVTRKQHYHAKLLAKEDTEDKKLLQNAQRQ